MSTFRTFGATVRFRILETRHDTALESLLFDMLDFFPPTRAWLGVLFGG